MKTDKEIFYDMYYSGKVKQRDFDEFCDASPECDKEFDSCVVCMAEFCIKEGIKW